MKTFTKLMSVLLIAVMCVGMLGTSAFAGFGGFEDFSTEPAATEAPVATAAPVNPQPAGGDVGGFGGFGDSGTAPQTPSYDPNVNFDNVMGSESFSGEVSEDGSALEGVAQQFSLNGGTPYATLTEAVAAITGTKATITLLGNATLAAASAAVIDKAGLTELTLNLNGKTLDMSACAGGIAVNSATKVLVAGAGTIVGKGTGFTMFSANSGSVEVYNGSFKAYDTFGSGTVTLIGGRYYEVNPVGGTVVTKTGYVAKATQMTNSVTGTNFYVYDIVPAVAELGGTSYATLKEAIAAATAGNTIQLVNNVSGEDITIDKQLTLDLNGKTITEKSSIVLDAALTVTDADDSGSIKGSSSGATLFTINDATDNTSNIFLTISGGYMSNYSALYSRKSTGTGFTPVDLTGGLYDVKPAQIDIRSGMEAVGTRAPYAIGTANAPTITDAAGNVYDAPNYVKKGTSGWVNNGAIAHFTGANATKNKDYTLICSAQPTAIASDGGTSIDVATYVTQDTATGKWKVSIPTNSTIFSVGATPLIAGKYLITFTFANGTVDVPMYVLPEINASTTAITLPNTSLDPNAVVYTFATDGEVAKLSSIVFKSSTAEKVLTAGTDYNKTPATKTVTLDYDFLNDNYAAGSYTVYFNYDNRVNVYFPLTISGTTAFSPSPSIPGTTPTVAPSSTVAPTSTPTSTTATIARNSANPYAVWHRGASAALKFDINPSNAAVYVGGSLLTANVDYVVSGNVLTLKDSYLRTLRYLHDDCISANDKANGISCGSIGSYTIAVVSPYDNSRASTTFTTRPGLYDVYGTYHTYGGTKTLSYTASDTIVGVRIGSKALVNDSSHTYYQLSGANNTTVTLTAYCLNTLLGIGNYSLTVLINDGFGTTHTTNACDIHVVSSSYAAIADKMGDSSNIYIWIAVLVICAIAIVALIPKKKKQPVEGQIEQVVEDQVDDKKPE